MDLTSKKLWDNEFFRSINPHVLTVGFHQAQHGFTSGSFNRIQTDFDIWYISSGAGSVKIDSQWMNFGKGELVTIKPGQSFQQERADDNDPFAIYFVHVLPFGKDIDKLDLKLAKEWPTKITTMSRPEEVGDSFINLFEGFTAQPPGFQLRIKTSMFRVLLNIDANFSRLNLCSM